MGIFRIEIFAIFNSREIFESAHAHFWKRDFLLNAWAKIFFENRNQRKLSRRIMYLTIRFILNLPMLPIFRTYSSLRNKEFARKRRQIQYESHIHIHHLTRNFTLISILKSLKYFHLHILRENRV